MSKQVINIGSAANDGTGDPIREAFGKTNANFTELYDFIETFPDVALTGNYDDLTNKPVISTVGTTGEYNDLLNTPDLGTVASQDGYAVPIGGTSGQVLAKASGTDGDVEWVDQTGGGGGGGITNIVDDTSPQLGGNLDLNSFLVGDADAADLTKLSELTATSTELNYVDGVTGAIQTQLDGKVAKSDFNANTILTANTDDSPTATTINEDRLVGRITGGNITDLTSTQVRTLLNVEDGATADQTASEIRDSLETLTSPNRLDYSAIEGLDLEPAAQLYSDAVNALSDADKRTFIKQAHGLVTSSSYVYAENALLALDANTQEVKAVAASPLADPDADRLLFWDDSAGELAYLEVGSGLSLSGTTLTSTSVDYIPQNSQNTDYTLVLDDANKHIFHPSADTTGRTFTIPANSSVAFPIGTAISFVNQNGAGDLSIAITTDTMRLAGAGTTGTRTLADNGMATALKITSTEWIISGVGLT